MANALALASDVIDPMLAGSPTWRALDVVERRPHAGLDIDAMRHAIRDGWRMGVPPLRALVQAGFDWDYLNIFAWATIRDLEVVNIGQYVLRPELWHGLSLETAANLHILPIEVHPAQRRVMAAIANLNNMEAMRELQLRFPGHEVRMVLADPRDIEAALANMRDSLATADLARLSATIESSMAAVVDDSDDANSDSDVVRLARGMVEQALSVRASDIHIDPNEHDALVRFRVDGVLQVMTHHDLRVHASLTNYIKNRSNLDIANTRIPQDGGYNVRLSDSGQTVHLRVATMPTHRRLGDVALEKITLRLVATDESLQTLDDLHFNYDVYDDLKNCFAINSGMVVITGPTGSGKTTTLYAALRLISDVSRNILTVEDPIERRMDGVNQVQVNVKAGMGYPQALRGFLRHDPDVLLVGEIRADTETVRIALEAAMTGRLVLTSTHTSSAAEVPTRLLFMGMEPYVVSSTLRAVISQRLIRTLCDHCKQPVELAGAALEIEWPDDNTPETIYKAVGCAWCKGTGYRGRAAIAEIMRMDEGLEDLICSRMSTRELQEYAVKVGMRTLAGDALVKVAAGETSLEEQARVAP